LITEAASQMTQQTIIMNAQSAPNCANARHSLNDLAAALAERIISGIIDFGLGIAMAGHRAIAAQATAAPTVLSSERMATPARPIGAGDTLARFQREIVPELDAAYNFARFLSRDADAAQDIVQEAFLRAYRSFDGYQAGNSRAWIFAIVRNCYRDWLADRRRKARLEVDMHGDDAQEDPIDNVASEEDGPETALLRRAESGAVRRVLNTLPRPLREILVLRELEGLSYRQIADIAALPIGTVMSRLARARKRFETIWQQQPDQENPT
jgi:RNA polymerase sigma factor (sigma-70 family)